MEIRQDQLTQILPGNQYVEHWTDALNKILPDYDITTPQRVAAFLAQTAHESGGYNALHENLNYTAQSLCNMLINLKKLLIVPMLVAWAMATKRQVMAGTFVGVDYYK